MRYEAEAVETFRRVYNGSNNFMTPDLVDCFMVGRYAVEISSGYGMNNDTVYGVTVIQLPGDIRRNDLSQLCQTKEEVLKYIITLEVEDLTQTEG